MIDLIVCLHTLQICRFYFDFSTMYVGVGMICPYLINVSLLLGAILSWGIMWPLIEAQEGNWYQAGLGQGSFHGIQGYRVRNQNSQTFSNRKAFFLNHPDRIL